LVTAGTRSAATAALLLEELLVLVIITASLTFLAFFDLEL
jgi:hypothetical protein